MYIHFCKDRYVHPSLDGLFLKGLIKVASWKPRKKHDIIPIRSMGRLYIFTYLHLAAKFMVFM